MQQIQVLLLGTFWNFFPTTLDLWLVEYSYAEPASSNTKNQLYYYYKHILQKGSGP